MTIKMLMFEFRDTEKKFFADNIIENMSINFYEYELNEETVKDLPQEIKDETCMISVFVNSRLTMEVMKQFKNLRLVSTRSTGYNHINTAYACENNIAVINIENYGSTSVVQYTLGLILALVRNIIPAYMYVQKIKDSKQCLDYIGRDLKTLTLGVVGTGSIGAEVCKIASYLGMNVIANDILPKQQLLNACEMDYQDLPVLLRESDIVTIHLPYTGGNYNMFDREKFNMMKKDAFFINTSRGEIVNMGDLYDALESKHLKGAALDVIKCESYNFHCAKFAKKPDTPNLYCIEEHEIIHKMLKMPNVIITPHIAYATQEAVDTILKETIDSILCYIKGDHKNRVV